jgi:hypothetical protein
VVWGQIKAFVEKGWTIHVVFSKNASNILVDACNANGLEVNTVQVSTIGLGVSRPPKKICRAYLVKAAQLIKGMGQ